MAMSIALRDQYNRRDLIGSSLLSVTTALVILRFCILANFFDGGETSTPLMLAEIISSMYIMPFTYMYLCDQCGTQWNDKESIFMLCLPVLSLLTLVPSLKGIDFRAMVVIIQCITITYCMYRLWERIKEFQMLFTRQLKVYYAWMGSLLLLTIISFAFDMGSSTSDTVKWLFFILFTAVITIGYMIVPYSFMVRNTSPSVEEEDLSSVKEEDEKMPIKTEAEDQDNFPRLSEHLAEAMHKMMEEELYYLKANISIDGVAQRLGTNRTYVTRLMKQEYGLTFIEYVNVARIQYSQMLLYKSPNITLEEVATKSGFQSSSNYCRAFKRYTGSTPRGWLQETPS